MTLSTKPLTGMRQRYPDALRVEKYVIDCIRKAGISYGFEEYDCPVLEPMSLFLAKSGNELAREQSYNFTDKGGRELIMRPELTPSLARMIAADGELIWPVRWMSFPLCYRYERPQRGRVREFLQFNCDILGSDDLLSELEIFLLFRRMMDNLGVSPDLYRIGWSSRRFATACLERSGFSSGEQTEAFAVIDKRARINQETWNTIVVGKFPDEAKAEVIRKFADMKDPDVTWIKELVGDQDCYRELLAFRGMLEGAGMESAVFDAGIVRGLDYYTGIVFEVMDVGSDNRRALCGGGRYDDLVGLFGGKNVSGTGFGLGILTLTLFLETYNLIPEEITLSRKAQVFMTVYSSDMRAAAVEAAESLRNMGLSVEIYPGRKDLARQFRLADREKIPWVAVLGPSEIDNAGLSLKNMKTGQQDLVSLESIPALILAAENDTGKADF